MRVFLLSIACLTCLNLSAKDDITMMKLEAEMLKLISTNDREKFTEVTEKLKTESQKRGDERMFYTAGGNQSTYEATHLNYVRAGEIADKIAGYAEEQNSYWGSYIALHVKAVNALQKQDYQEAEDAFLKAVYFRHKYFPGARMFYGTDLPDDYFVADQHGGCGGSAEASHHECHPVYRQGRHHSCQHRI